MKVAVIEGGDSSERAVSLVTAREIRQALTRSGHSVIGFNLDRSLPAGLVSAAPDVVFPALHGGKGENGALQGCLEVLGIPYVGSDVLSSALAMSKWHSKLAFERAGLKCPRGVLIPSGTTIDEAASLVRAELGGPPYIVKPNSEGSALGTTRAFTSQLLHEGLVAAMSRGGEVLVEEFIEGRELTVGVLDVPSFEGALPPIEIVPAKEWYDYEARYTPGLSEHVVRPDLGQHLLDALVETGRRAHRALGCRHLSRTDCLLKGDVIYLLEVNTLPGMTPTSLFPDAARASGIEFDRLIDLLVRAAANPDKPRSPTRS